MASALTDATEDADGEAKLSETLPEAVYWVIFALFLPAILGALQIPGLLVRLGQKLPMARRGTSTAHRFRRNSGSPCCLPINDLQADLIVGLELRNAVAFGRITKLPFSILFL